MAEKERVNVEVSSGGDWAWVVLILALIVLTYGEPDLLDVIAEFCRRYIEGPANG